MHAPFSRLAGRYQRPSVELVIVAMEFAVSHPALRVRLPEAVRAG